MGEISTKSEITETKTQEAEGYTEIKPEEETTPEDACDFWDKTFEEDTSDNEEESSDGQDAKESDDPEEDLEQVLEDYFQDLKDKSECPETIPDRPFDKSDLKKRTPEENAEMREEFDDKKAQLKKEWEEANGRPWPKYDHDVYSANGKLIRKAGSDYDAHHIQPLGMGGKNEASNITPLNAEVHYDKQGVHAPDSPYSKMDQMLGGTRE